ncbi:hypothetical protein BR269_005200, partial [Escherichia coli]
MQTITIAPPKRSWFSLLSWAISAPCHETTNTAST